ncbi:MAG: hypothetical protein EOP83_10700 [Verrucomicrobiaceae bacterium]|nr:MAG: hypothetical protein EOP83_10700 [Verrucomicrobiaceae bacterium]
MRAFEITEAFNTGSQPVTWTERSEDAWTAKQQFGEHLIICELFRDIPLSSEKKLPWTFQFASKKKGEADKNVPTGEARSKNMQILGYVVACLRDFIEKAEPVEVVFKGNRANGLAALYKAMAGYLRPQLHELGYVIQETKPGYFSISPQGYEPGQTIGMR